jgi:pseudouridine kinase
MLAKIASSCQLIFLLEKHLISAIMHPIAESYVFLTEQLKHMKTLETSTPHVLVVGGVGIDRYKKHKNQGPWRMQDIESVHPEVVLELGGKGPSNNFGEFVGGNGANTATGLARLGERSSLYTHLGNDSATYFIKGKIHEEGIKLYDEFDKQGTNDDAFVTLYEADGITDRYIFSSKGDMRRDFDPTKIQEKPDYVYLTAIGGEPQDWAKIYKKVIDYARREDIPVAISPGSAQLNNKNETLYESIGASNLLIVNKEEAIDLLRDRGIKPPSEEIESVMQALRRLGPKMFSVTYAAEGSYFMTQNERIHKLGTFPTKKVDTTGAGDAYAAGLMSGIVEGESIGESMRRGAADASSVLTKYGAGEGLLTRDEMEGRLKEHATVQPEVIYEPKQIWPIQSTSSK